MTDQRTWKPSFASNQNERKNMKYTHEEITKMLDEAEALVAEADMLVAEAQYKKDRALDLIRCAPYEAEYWLDEQLYIAVSKRASELLDRVHGTIAERKQALEEEMAAP